MQLAEAIEDLTERVKKRIERRLNQPADGVPRSTQILGASVEALAEEIGILQAIVFDLLERSEHSKGVMASFSAAVEAMTAERPEGEEP